MRSDREHTIAAYHEAGHCVAALALGWRVEQAGIYRTPTMIDGALAGGVCRVRPPRGAQTIGRTLENAIILAGGLVAQRRFAPRSSRAHAATDRQHADNAMLFVLGAGSRDLMQRTAAHEAKAIIEAKWPLVEKLAGRFLESATPVSGKIIARIAKDYERQTIAAIKAHVAKHGRLEREDLEAWQDQRRRSARRVTRRHVGEIAFQTIAARLASGDDGSMKGEMDRCGNYFSAAFGISPRLVQERIDATLDREVKRYGWRRVGS